MPLSCRPYRAVLIALLLLLVAAACQHHDRPPTPSSAELIARATGDRPVDPPEATSLLGQPLYPLDLPSSDRARLEADLAAARRAFDAAPDDEQAIIWLGRRLAYLGRYREAIEVYTHGLDVHPDSPRLRRHRGHRFITLRRFEDALADLDRAADLIADTTDEVEPDGMPNALGQPRSTLHTNIHYHRALALYLLGRFDDAAESWQQCLDAADNDDMRVAASYWLYLAHRQAGRDDRAAAVLRPISADMNVIENMSYHRLLLFFKGAISADDVVNAAVQGEASIDEATVGYGLGAWHMLEGNDDSALAHFRRIVNMTNWAAFGHIASEVELARRAE